MRFLVCEGMGLLSFQHDRAWERVSSVICGSSFSQGFGGTGLLCRVTNRAEGQLPSVFWGDGVLCA